MMKRLLILTLCSSLVYATDTSIPPEDGGSRTSTLPMNGAGDTLEVKATGSIVTPSGDAVVMNAGQQAVTVYGESNPGGGDAGLIQGAGIGIIIYASDATITNSGTITSSMHWGIFINASGATITNSAAGLIQGAVDGIFINASGDNATISNSGTITGAVDGIGINTSDATISNSGTITGAVDDGIHIYASGENATITNSGTITGEGVANGEGIYINASGATISNSGTITGEDDGIDINASGATISNSGTITGQTNSGIDIDGSDATISNSGTIQTSNPSGATSYAIEIVDGASSPTLNLKRGSKLIGRVISEEPLAVTVERGLNVYLELAEGSAPFGDLDIDEPYVRGPITVDVLDNSAEYLLMVEPTNPVLQVDLLEDMSDSVLLTADSVSIEELSVVGGAEYLAAVDPTHFVMQVDLLEDMSDSVLSGIYQTESLSMSCPSTSASSKCAPTLTAKMLPSVTGLGSTRTRRIQGLTSKDSQGGFTLGDAFSLGRNNVLGVYFASLWGKGSIGPNISELTSEAYLGGVSYEHSLCNLFIAGSIASGYYQASNSRNVMNNLVAGGVELASGKSKGALLISDVSVAYALLDTCIFCPILNVSMRYYGLYLDGYRENNPQSNLVVESRNTSLIKPQLILSLRTTEGLGESLQRRRRPRNKIKSILYFNPYAGIAGRFQVGGRNINGQLAGQPLSFNIGGKKDLVEFLYGFSSNVSIPCSQGILAFFFNIQGLVDNANSTRFLGEGGFRYQF